MTLTTKATENLAKLKDVIHSTARMHGRNVEFTDVDEGVHVTISPSAASGPIPIHQDELDHEDPADLAGLILREAGL